MADAIYMGEFLEALAIYGCLPASLAGTKPRLAH